VSSHSIAILVTIGFSAAGVVGDYCLKLASEQDTPLQSVWFLPPDAVRLTSRYFMNP
jgi:small multidrug resistance pump